MRGQWIGSYSGTNTGTIIVNADEYPSYFQGIAYLTDDNKQLPGTAAIFRTNDKNPRSQFRATLLAIDPNTSLLSSWDNIKRYYDPTVVSAQWADANSSLGKESLTLSWETNIGTTGTCILPRSNADKPSEIIPSDKTWDAYKAHVAKLEGRRYLFRGQKGPWRLRTAFHRSGRYDLHRFLNEDIQLLHKRLSARTKHLFNLNIPDENGAFFNLIQHHGYPTPLLDWTYSPYVAAFFAYRGISNKMAADADPAEKVRIHVLDQFQWKTDLNQVFMLLTTAPHLSVGEFMAVENDRTVPQQAASTVTNLDDIETYIRTKETGEKKYLWAIDLPVRERKLVVQELSYMGITAGSLFPGLDGTCEELRERNFGV